MYRPASLVFGFFLLATSLWARVIHVPAEHVTIKSAVFAAEDGDTVEVDDGTYFEDCVRLNKRLTVRARNPYGAVIYGGSQSKGLSAIFIVQAPVEVSGFVLKNARFGLIQRSSPDVAWAAHHLFICNMSRAAVAVNARTGNVGRASVHGIIVDHCAVGFQTSEARSLDVRNCLVANCAQAFRSYNHVSFTADQVTVWNCGQVVSESLSASGPGATNRISLGDVRVFTREMFRGKGRLVQDPEIAAVLGEIEKNWSRDGLPPAARELLEGLIVHILGEISLEAGRDDKARSFFGRALDISRRRNFSELVWLSLYGLADAFRKSGNTEAALARYEQAIREVEGIRSEYGFKLYNPGYYEDKISLYESLLNLLYDLNLRQPGRGYGLRALEHIENTKARGFVQSLREAEIFSSLGLARKLRPERMKPNDRINDIQIALQSRRLTPAARAALLDDLERAHEDVKSTYIRVRQRTPILRRVPLFEAASAEEIRGELLDDRTLLIEYFLGEKQSYAIGLTKNRMVFARLDPLEDIISLAARYGRYLTLRGGRKFAGAAGSRRLYKTLMSPFADLFDERLKRIIIVPGENLHYLPFETLLRPAVNNKGVSRYLIEDFNIIYAPSASAMLVLSARPRREDVPLDFLGIANTDRGDGNQVYLPTLRSFPPLPWAQKEVRVAAEFFVPERVRLMAGETVSESDFLDQPLEKFRILHFATHGFYDDVNWQRSTLLLDQDPDGRLDGFLQLQDVYLLPLRADLVVLSACRSGLGRLEKGEGPTGVSYAFLYAGARSLINSLWSVADESSVEFMRAFYSRLTAGLTKSAALREAKREMLRGRHAHPFYWAGFILIGEDSAFVRR